MAHNINFANGKHSFFSVKEKAWHGLGQIVDQYPTSAEAIKFAGLDYEIEKREIFANSGDQFTKIPGYFSTVRTDNDAVLGVVGAKYEVMQNADAFTFFDCLVSGAEQIKYETAGALGAGERIFITAKMPEVIRVSRKDEIEKYIFLTTSHDGSGSIMAAFTPVRIVCNNTLNMALNNKTNAIYIKHTANAGQRLQEAGRIIHLVDETSAKLNLMFQKWATVRISDAELKKLIRLAMAPSPEIFQAVASADKKYEFSKQFEDVCGQVFEYAQIGAGQELATTAGTLFGFYNSITGYYQNVNEYKTGEQKLNSIMFGTAQERSKKAFQLCEQAGQHLS